MSAARERSLHAVPPNGYPTRLPQVQNSLIGREADLDRLAALADAAAIVTVTGLGGAGKTRLALEYATRVARTGRRVWFVELADLERASDVVGAIAEHIGIVVVAGGPPADALVARRLGEEPTLLVLDNMEHLLAAAGDVATLADADPNLRIVVTSRSRLRVRDERTFVVRGLALASARRSPAATPSVQLFVERLDAGEPTTDDLDTAAAICAAVGGLPLAIELAAFHARTLGADTVRKLVETDSTLLVLDNGLVDTPERQQSLRGSFEWSYRLLDSGAQRAFRVLGAFSGSFDLDAFTAAALTDAPTQPVLSAFMALVEHHLVEPTDRGESATRFTMSPPLRELARGLLADDDELDDITARHADYFATVARNVGRLTDHGHVRDAISIYRADRANLLAALRYFLDRGDDAVAATISCSLSKIWEELAQYGLLREWFDLLFAAAGAAGRVDELPIEAHMIASYLALLARGAESVAEQLTRLETAIERARAAHDHAAVLRGLAFMTLSYATHGSVERSAAAADDGRALADRIGEAVAAAEFTMWRAMLANQAGDLAGAQEHGHDAMQRARRVGDDRLIVRTALLFASTPALDGTGPAGVPPLDVLLELARSTGNVLDELYVTTHLGMREATHGDAIRAFGYARDALLLARRTGALHLELPCLFIVATATLRTGDDASAARFYASIAPNAAGLRALTRPGVVDRYERNVASRRSAFGAANFDRHVRAASARSWDDEIAAAERYAARQARRDTSGGITPRERDVLTQLVTGATNKEIAAALGLTAKTVTHHCAAIYRKLGVQTRAEATAYALSHSLV